MLSNDAFTGVFGFAEPGDNSMESMLAVAKAATRAGFPVLLVDPNSKLPVCPLTTVMRKRADNEAQRAAEEAGRPSANVKHPCGLDHATTDTALIGRWIKHLMEGGARYNLAWIPGAAGYIGVDVDTAEEKAAFFADRTEHEGVDHSEDEVTVSSPGQMDKAGEMVHKNGGHVYFELPDGVDFRDAPVSVFTSPNGYLVKFGPRSYILVPPSARPEGPYVQLQPAQKAPEWLIEKIQEVIQRRADHDARRAARVGFEDDPIDAWNEDTTWVSLLEADGWTPTGKPESCSPDCLQWTKPEGAATPKSATGHESGCGRGFEHALHLWTSNMPRVLGDIPADTRRVTKLQYVAWRDHGGDASAAMRELGLTRKGADERGVWAEVEDDDEGDLTPAERLIRTDPQRHERDALMAAETEQGQLDLSDGAVRARNRELNGEFLKEPGEALDPALYGLDDPDKIWPEDVMTKEEWQAGWHDRQVVQGRMTPEEAANYQPTRVDVRDLDDRGGDAGPTTSVTDVEDGQLVAPVPVSKPVNPLGNSKAKPKLGEDAKHGLAWDIAMAMDPGTEADPVAVMFLILAATGNFLGRDVYALGDHKQNPGRIWPLLIGDTQAGKKGTALHAMEDFVCRVDRDYWDTAHVSGLSTAEGLITLVTPPVPPKDASDDDEDGFDPGEAPFDKRKLVVEEEFGTLLGRSRREGNVLSGEIRKAYDGVQMAVRTRKDPLVAEGHHITIIGAITPEELLHQLTAVDTANGFGNRFLPVYSFRSKSLPLPEDYNEAALRDCIGRFDQMARRAATLTQPVSFTEKGAKVWVDFYNGMNQRAMPNGVVTSLINRWAPNTLRLALLYAVMDGQPQMDEAHVRAAIACWEYVESTIRFVFNDEDVDEDLQRVIEFIHNSPVGARTRNDVYEQVFGKKRGAKFLDDLRAKLVATERFEVVKKAKVDEKTGAKLGGRPTEFWQRVTVKKESK